MYGSSICWWRLRKLLSAAVWLFLPTLVLVGSRCCSQGSSFRARPLNDSYDAMFIAAMAGIGLTSIWAIFAGRKRSSRTLRQTYIPLYFSWRNAFDLFELCACASLAITNVAAGVLGSAIVWAVAFFILIGLSVAVAREQKESAFEGRLIRTAWTWAMSALLVVFASLFIAFPVLQSWSGPPELFVRWHPFSVPAELIWRGVFFSFAFGMLLTAFDPSGRHSLFIVALVLSGYLHAAEMAADNLFSAHMGHRNGNHEHLYGDILGWFAIASFALLFLRLDRSPRVPYLKSVQPR